MLNVVLFGKTAKQWRDENPRRKGNIRYELDKECRKSRDKNAMM